MKKLVLAVALFIVSDAAFAHSSVLSGDNKGTAPALDSRYRTVVVVEPSVPAPTRASEGHKLKSTGAKDDSSVMAFLLRWYLYFAR